MTGVDDSDAICTPRARDSPATCSDAALVRTCSSATRGDPRRRGAARAGATPRSWFLAGAAAGVGLLDAGLAVADPHSELRRRLYLMFAILESSPEYHELFLPPRPRPGTRSRSRTLGCAAG